MAGWTSAKKRAKTQLDEDWIKQTDKASQAVQSSAGWGDSAGHPDETDETDETDIVEWPWHSPGAPVSPAQEA